MAVAGDASSVAVAGALAEPLTEVLVPVSLPLVPFLTVVHTRSFREARGRLSFGKVLFCPAVRESGVAQKGAFAPVSALSPYVILIRSLHLRFTRVRRINGLRSGTKVATDVGVRR